MEWVAAGLGLGALMLSLCLLHREVSRGSALREQGNTIIAELNELYPPCVMGLPTQVPLSGCAWVWSRLKERWELAALAPDASGRLWITTPWLGQSADLSVLRSTLEEVYTHHTPVPLRAPPQDHVRMDVDTLKKIKERMS